MSRIVISDVHGCMKTLEALIAQLPKDVPITFAGDLIDRGKDSSKVIDFVKNGGYDCVVGNHEVMMMEELKFRINPDGKEVPHSEYYHGIWAMNGGDNCMESYRYDAEEELSTGEKIKVRPYDTAKMREHVAWLKTLPYYIEYKDLKNAKGDYLLVSHTTPAGAWEDLNHDSAEFKNEVTWNRPFGEPPKIEGIYSIFGHTPQPGGATVKEHFACIDGGCYFKRAEYGVMYALQFPEMTLYKQNNAE